MRNRIDWTVRATRQLLRLEAREQRAIRDAVATLGSFPFTPGVRRLVDHDPPFRLRAGRFRVLFSFDGMVRVVTIEQVAKRDEHTY